MSARQESDPSQTDREWLGYHPRALAPAGAALAAVSLFVWTGRWYLDDMSALAERVGALAVFALAWGAWPALGAVFLYRTVTYTYRLTDRALVADYGSLFRPVPPVPLAEVAEVRHGAGPLARALGVGWVEARTATRAVRLTGVRRPAAVAHRLRAAVKAARG